MDCANRSRAERPRYRGRPPARRWCHRRLRDQRWTYSTDPSRTQGFARLFPAGATVDPLSIGGCTAMTVAAQNGHDTVVARLLAAEAAIDHANSEEATPLTLAAQNGHDAIVARLLAGGVAVDVANNEGLTALMMAAKVREERTAEVLLRYGADPSRRNKAGLSAERPSLLGAISNGHWEQYPTWGSPIRLSPASGLRPTSTAPTPPPISMESASASRTNRPMSGIYRRLSSTCRLPKIPQTATSPSQ
jgi:hypothetical protein